MAKPLVSVSMVVKTLGVTPQAARRIGLLAVTGRGGFGHGECFRVRNGRFLWRSLRS